MFSNKSDITKDMQLMKADMAALKARVQILENQQKATSSTVMQMFSFIGKKFPDLQSVFVEAHGSAGSVASHAPRG